MSDADTILRELVAVARLRFRYTNPSIRDLDSGKLPEIKKEHDRRNKAAWGEAFTYVKTLAAPPAAHTILRDADDALVYATSLARSLQSKHCPEVTQWRPLPDLLGVLTQIDNMVAGLTRADARRRRVEQEQDMAYRHQLVHRNRSEGDAGTRTW
jgi:hypothetical protein